MDFTALRSKLFLFFILVITVFFACTKISTTDIGSGLIPPVDGVITKDTVLEVISKNKSIDTVTVGFSDDHVLGYVHDQVFGTTTASLNFQVEPPTTPLSFGAAQSDLIFDSVILSLHYTGVWGDSTSHLLLNVYEMDPENKFIADSPYNNTISFEKATPLNETGIAQDISVQNINDIDTFTTYNEDVTNQVRIRLNSVFGERLLNYDTSVVYGSAASFNNYFRGFIVEPAQQPVSNALIRISLTDTSTRLSLYYHYTTAGVLQNAVRRFAANALTSASSNTIIHNYVNTDIPKYFPSNTDSQDNLIYLQTSPGTYATLSIPGITGLSNRIIHRAEVLMQQVPDVTSTSDTLFSAPNLFLAAYNKDSMKRFAVPIDVLYSGGTISNLTTFGVNPIKKTDSYSNQTIATYSFDISRYVQSIVTKKDSLFDFVLLAPYNAYIPPTDSSVYTYPISSPSLNAPSIGRVRLGGGNNAQYKMRLHIVYSGIQ